MTNILIAIAIGFVGYILFKNYKFRMLCEQAYNKRFLVVPTMLYIFPKEQDQEDEHYEDEMLRKLMGKEKVEESRKSVNTRTVIDLEQVQCISEWSTSTAEDDKIINDCCLVVFKDGSDLLVFEPFDSMQDSLSVYLGYKYV